MINEFEEKNEPIDFDPDLIVDVSYFLDGIPENLNLLDLDIESKYFFGLLRQHVENAKIILHELEGGEIISILRFGDLHVSKLIRDGVNLVDAEGNSRKITVNDLDSIERTGFLTEIIRFLDEMGLLFYGESRSKDDALEVTPVRFCAALALSEAYRANEFIDFAPKGYFSNTVGYHAMKVAEVMAVAKILSRENDELFPLLAQEAFSIRAQQGAAARLMRDSDGKQAAKRETKRQWEAWQSGATRYRSGAAFAKHIVETQPIENTKTVENWMRKWRAEREG